MLDHDQPAEFELPPRIDGKAKNLDIFRIPSHADILNAIRHLQQSEATPEAICSSIQTRFRINCGLKGTNKETPPVFEFELRGVKYIVNWEE